MIVREKVLLLKEMSFVKWVLLWSFDGFPKQCSGDDLRHSIVPNTNDSIFYFYFFVQAIKIQNELETVCVTVI